MIVIDTSALMAVLAAEPDAEAIARRAALARSVVMSAGTGLELSIVVSRRWGDDGRERSDALLWEMRVDISAVDAAQMRVAIDAYGRFGRGSGHPAQLNYGDCFSYALARTLDAPLLFKGDDFRHTDVRSALDLAA